MFKNKEFNKNGAQLLFTSHDMYTLKNTVFRRDEIWFAAENDSHEIAINMFGLFMTRMISQPSTSTINPTCTGVAIGQNSQDFLLLKD